MYKEKYVINFFKADQDEMQRKTRGFSKIMVELIAEAAFGELEKLQQECKQMRYSAQGYLEDSKVSPEEKKYAGKYRIYKRAVGCGANVLTKINDTE